MSPSNKQREVFAVIDIGSNSIRSMIVEPLPDGTYRVLDDERETIRLASGMKKSGRLSSVSIRKAILALSRMRQIAHSRGVKKYSVIATSAVREAKNRKDFIDRVRNQVGLRIRVLSGNEEATLAFESAAHSYDLTGIHSAVLDVGGGSAELILAVGNNIKEILSLPMGAVATTESYIHSDPPKLKETKKLAKEIRKQLKDAHLSLDPPPQMMVASGGTATSLAQISMSRQGLSGHSAQGYEMTQADVVHVLGALTRRNVHARKELLGLSLDRADIIVAGVTTILEFMLFLKVNSLKIGGRGIRHALIRRIILKNSKNLIRRTSKKQRVAAAEAFGRSLKVERKHAEHVQQMALSIFDQLKDKFSLEPEQRELLSAAAYLHDVGYVVSYRQHHKHSHHLISHAQLDGFTPGEKEMIAQIARYHRATEPKKRHQFWKSIPKLERKTVRKLAAILRVADAIDRRHTQKVKSVRVHTYKDKIRLLLDGPGPFAVEEHGVKTKSQLFEKVFNCELAVVDRATPRLQLVPKTAKHARR